MIKSNLKEVIGRVRRLESGIAAAVARAVEPKYWKPRLQTSAEKTLRSLWALERNVALRAAYEKLSPQIVATLEALVMEAPGGVMFTMSVPEMRKAEFGVRNGAAVNVAAATGFNLARQTPGGQTSKNFRLPAADMAGHLDNLEQVRAGILEWVRTEKIKDERDTGLTDEEIAERLEWIMGLSRGSSQKAVTDTMQDAGERLASRIQAFMDAESLRTANGGEANGSRVEPDAEVVGEWLAAVLATWRSLLVASLPARVSFEVARELKRVEGTML